jgi:rhodanese-related sulfurtransferase
MNFLSKLFGGGAPQLDIEAYLEDYYKQNNHVLIDVRTEREFKGGHVQGARNIPLNEIGAKLRLIPKDKTVILVCQSGSRSNVAARTLMQAGYENVINLRGGTGRWRRLGHPVK